MFAQVITGRTADAEALRTRFDEWRAQQAPQAVGWLGSTGGVADDGTFVLTARFESRDAATANSGRPEQSAWWEQTSALLDDVTFQDCDDVVPFGSGGSDDAGFVQVMQGRVTDAEEMKRLGAEMDEQMAGFRPDVIGGYTALHGDGGFTSVVYFTSEAEARANEHKEAPPEMQDLMARDAALYEGEMTFIDLKDPWTSSP